MTTTSKSTGTPTADLAAFASQLRFDAVPTAVVEHAKLALVDLLGCALYGATLPWTGLVHDYVQSEGARPRSSVWGTVARTSPTLAALANGTAAHAAEIDDLHRASFYHPSAATVPAALAVADDLTGVDGRALLTAIIAGYEVGTRVGAALGQGHFMAGYHPQGTNGVFSAAAAAGHLLRLDPQQMVHALGTAGTQASGLMAAQEGSMVKRMHSGLAGQTGVRAATLAASGFTGIEDVFEASFGGLLGTLGTAASDASLLTADLGQVWNTARIEFKWHAACAAIHTSLDVVDELLIEHAIAAADVARVRVYCTTHAFLHCGFDYVPSGVTAAQMSYQYCVAAMLLFGVVSIDQFDESLLADPALLALAARVEVIPQTRFDELGPDKRHSVEIEIDLFSRAPVRGARTQRKGGADDPVEPDRVIDKYRRLAAHSLSGPEVETLLLTIQDLDNLSDAHELTSRIAGSR
jgi:2-methylcitrate dehydratase PrpD